MENRIAILGIFIQDLNQSAAVNAQLHEYSNYIVGRLGIPYRDRNMSIICIVLDAPNDMINALSGKLGRLPGVRAQAQYAK